MLNQKRRVVLGIGFLVTAMLCVGAVSGMSQRGLIGDAKLASGGDIAATCKHCDTDGAVSFSPRNCDTPANNCKCTEGQYLLYTVENAACVIDDTSIKECHADDTSVSLRIVTGSCPDSGSLCNLYNCPWAEHATEKTSYKKCDITPY